MAWAWVAHRGSNSNKTGTSVALNPTADLNVGVVVLVKAVSDNLGITSAESTEQVT